MIKDKNEIILKVGDRVQDKKGELWRIENINGVTFMTRYNSKNKMVETKPFRKFDFATSRKV